MTPGREGEPIVMRSLPSAGCHLVEASKCASRVGSTQRSGDHSYSQVGHLGRTVPPTVLGYLGGAYMVTPPSERSMGHPGPNTKARWPMTARQLPSASVSASEFRNPGYRRP